MELGLGLLLRAFGLVWDAFFTYFLQLLGLELGLGLLLMAFGLVWGAFF